MEIKVLETMMEKTHFRVEVSNRDTSSSERNFTMASDYMTRDMVRRQII